MEEKVLLNAVLVFPSRVQTETEVLMAVKAAKIGAGCWNGYGGGVEPGETILGAAVRELYEESGLQVLPQHLEKVAVVDFHNTKSDGGVFRCRVHVFMAPVWSGEVKATPEMLSPAWHPLSRLPLNKMMPADYVWFPLIFEGRPFYASAFYGPRQEFLQGPVEVKYVTPDELLELEKAA